MKTSDEIIGTSRYIPNEKPDEFNRNIPAINGWY